MVWVGHLTKLLTMPIYGEIFFNITLKLGIHHQGARALDVYSNHDPRLTYFLPKGFVWEKPWTVEIFRNY